MRLSRKNRVTNPNILNEQEELRRIKTEYDEEKMEFHKQALSKINNLEKEKGLSFKSKTTRK